MVLHFTKKMYVKKMYVNKKMYYYKKIYIFKKNHQLITLVLKRYEKTTNFQQAVDTPSKFPYFFLPISTPPS